jgi:hypothetical protein
LPAIIAGHRGGPLSGLITLMIARLSEWQWGHLSGLKLSFSLAISWGPIKKKTRYCQGWQGLELMACAATRLALDSFWAVLIFALESG